MVDDGIEIGILPSSVVVSTDDGAVVVFGVDSFAGVAIEVAVTEGMTGLLDGFGNGK